MGQPRLPDYATIEAMSGLTAADRMSVASIKRILRINDEQIAVNRFKWFNLPRGITGNQIERMLYFRGSVAFFCLGEGDKDKSFYILPYVLNGTIDLLGRYKTISPLPFNGKNEFPKTAEEAKNSRDPQIKLLSDIKADTLWEPQDIEYLEAMSDEELKRFIQGHAVILTDYTRQLPQQVIPKYRITEGIIDLESRMFPYARTALMNSTGVSGMRVESQDEQQNVSIASQQVEDAALNGKKWIALTSAMEIQELCGGNVAKAEEFLLTMQSMDNFRLGVYGIENGGIFEKKAHTTDLENSINYGTSSFALQDALWNRQQFCDIINSYTGFGMWVEPTEVATGADMNMDGMIGDEYDGEVDEETGEGGTDDAGSE